MKIVEIKALENGAHRNQTIYGVIPVPDGWAVIPDDMVCENFPFGEVEVEDVNGVITVTKWTAGNIPAPPEPTPAEKREAAYNTERIIEWDAEMLTVTEAAQMWQYYAAEGNDRAGQLTALIAEAKAKIREQYPDSK